MFFFPILCHWILAGISDPNASFEKYGPRHQWTARQLHGKVSAGSYSYNYQGLSHATQWQSRWSLLVSFLNLRHTINSDLFLLFETELCRFRDDFQRVAHAVQPIVSQTHSEWSSSQGYQDYLLSCADECTANQTTLSARSVWAQKPCVPVH